MKTTILIGDRTYEAEKCTCKVGVGSSDYDNIEDWVSSAVDEHGPDCHFALSILHEVQDNFDDDEFNNSLALFTDDDDVTDPGLTVYKDVA